MSQPRRAERGVPSTESQGCLPTATARARCCGDAGWRRQKERCYECLCIAKLPVNCHERSLFTEKGAYALLDACGACIGYHNLAFCSHGTPRPRCELLALALSATRSAALTLLVRLCIAQCYRLEQQPVWSYQRERSVGASQRLRCSNCSAVSSSMGFLF